MAAHVRVVEVPDADRRELEHRVGGKGAPAREVERARVVLLAADGVPGKRIAAIVGCAEQTVVTWRGRYAERGLAALEACRGPASGGAAGPGVGADPDRAAGPVRSDPLVLAASGRGAGRGGDADLARHSGPDLAPVRGATRTMLLVSWLTVPSRVARSLLTVLFSILAGVGAGAERCSPWSWDWLSR
jgi:hypothetical protein